MRLFEYTVEFSEKNEPIFIQRWSIQEF